MKKILILFSLVLSFAACSSDDDNTDNIEKKRINNYMAEYAGYPGYVNRQLQLCLYDDGTYWFSFSLPSNFGNEGSEHIIQSEGKYTKSNNELILEESAKATIAIRNNTSGYNQESRNITSLSSWFPNKFDINGKNIVSKESLSGYSITATDIK